MVKTIILVAIGSMFGGVSRYLATFFIVKAWPAAFPYGTFAVNTAGCFLIGLVLGIADRTNSSEEIRALLAVGFCGGFTTFSSFAFENLALIENRDLSTFAIYTTLSILVGLFATLIGLRLASA